ncbi:uncharacterized protein KY384_006287 [Bacidia gigantensis]|uniref:uncharacterized protein n=1 Tax=Bacidia gigantensis TaxID=2732470 RepID=UPI001D0522AF|nr:uncharacterized protein KY384_006287 [Bacidia gigantensis]KAG8528600.1 hypothetical protein KY384_006287 [Bacidia gigantensis]
MSGQLTQPSPSFSQQGQVDWVALSNSSVNFSVAALARFSRAGVDALTVQMGRTLGSIFRLAPHVQEEMHRAIRALKRYGLCQDVLWFGFGVKQIITDFSDTEEGLSFITLCSALLTTFDSAYVARVLREMCLRLKSPEGFTPSILQWKLLVDICSGILIGSHFSRVLHGFCFTTLDSVWNASRRQMDPETFAEALLEATLVHRGSTESLVFCGNADCSLLAAFAEQFLCLDISIFGTGRTVLHRSQKRHSDFPQLTFIRDANDIEDFAMTQKLTLSPVNHKLVQIERNGNVIMNVCLRSSWDTVLQDAFGESLAFWLSEKWSPFLLPLVQRIGSGNSIAERYYPLFETVTTLSEALPQTFGTKQSRDMPHHVLKMLPELRQCPFDTSLADDDELKEMLYLAPTCMHSNSTFCQGGECKMSVLGAISIFVRVLASSDIDEEVTPSSLGLVHLRNLLFNSPTDSSKYKNRTSPVQMVQAIFTGQLLEIADHVIGVPAESGRGICVYRAGIENPSSELDTALRLQIVRYVLSNYGDTSRIANDYFRGYLASNHQQYRRLIDLLDNPYDSVWSSKEIQVSNQQYQKPWLPQASGAIHRRLLLKETEKISQLEIAYKMHCPSVHANEQWAKVGLEHMMKTFNAVTHQAECGAWCQTFACLLDDNTLHQPMMDSKRLQITYKRPEVERIQRMLREVIVPQKHFILGYTARDADMRSASRQDKGCHLYVGDPYVLYLQWLLQSDGTHNIFLSAFTNCLACVIRGMVRHKHYDYDKRLMNDGNIDEGTVSAFHFNGLNDKEEVLDFTCGALGKGIHRDCMVVTSNTGRTNIDQVPVGLAEKQSEEQFEEEAEEKAEEETEEEAGDHPKKESDDE